MRRFALTLSAAIALIVPFAAAASDAKPAPPTDARSLEYEFAFRGHPDLQYRLFGVDRFRRGQYDEAMTLLRRAARFGDKPSQGLIAEMYAAGQGVPADMAMAYAWMDLAAERGYRDFVIRRERYWARMTEADRARAVTEGQAIYAEFGDAAAKPRFADQLRRASKEGVGSRTGFSGNVKVTIPSSFGDQTLDAAQLRSFSYWDPKKYWAMQDALWKNPGGRVDAGDLQDVRTRPGAAPAPANPKAGDRR
ncbi:tetratricopeptide repeat protein [Cognatilysobacter segetis]|uniref:tetratricopeptide repeat protein n=1 Tax=Cognatilysobacter segetis TaxID=2492394 RepID=UPI00105BFA23|nr:sel1 repeat family protein [Lysobacter segetis]